MVHLFKEAGPFAFLNLAAGVLGVLLAVVTLVLAMTKSKAASVTGVLCLLLALGILCLGILGYSLGIISTEKSIGNVPDDQKDLLLHKGTLEARANFLIALACAGLPLLAGALAVIVRRLVAGIVLAVVVSACSVAMLVAFTRPLPPEGPKVATVPGLELPHSSSSRRLGTWALIALTPDGLWVDGSKAPSLAQALAHPDVRERNTQRLPLLVDRRVQFGQLADVLQAAGVAGRHQIELVVRAPDGADRVITLFDAPEKRAGVPLLLTLSITDSALKIGATGSNLEPLPRDWRALNDKMAEIKTSFRDERTLRVTATPETSVGDLVAALDASRERDEKPLFDELVVGRFTLPRGDAPAFAGSSDQGVGTRNQGAGISDQGAGGTNVLFESKSDATIRGRVADVSPKVGSSGVDRDALNRYVKARKAAIVACYEKELRHDASLKGKVVVQFSISTSGRATEIEIAENSLGNDAVPACIKSVMRTWVFPFKPDAEVPVAFPFVFSPAM